MKKSINKIASLLSTFSKYIVEDMGSQIINDDYYIRHIFDDQSAEKGDGNQRK